MPSPQHSELTVLLTLEVTDSMRLQEYLDEVLTDEQASLEVPLWAYLREEMLRVAQQVPGLEVRGFRGGATGS